LPWRSTRDPYAVWISEAMLQQTRVETAEPYWRRFLERLPTLRELAAADEEVVLALWSGLGYYRRARALRAAAREIEARHGGEFPRQREAALALSGVGPYTAGAVLSIAYDLPEPLVDGNVARVLARCFLVEVDPSQTAGRRKLWDLAGRLVPSDGGAGDWNQALMELGATICSPRSPSCSSCPWERLCAAHQTGRESELPLARARPTPVQVELAVAWVERAGRLLLERRGAGGRMAGLWQLPTIELPGPDSRLTGLFPPAWPVDAPIRTGALLGEVRHTITRHRIRARVLAGRLEGPQPGRNRGVEWIPRDRLADLGLTGMARKILGAPLLGAARARSRAGSLASKG
jgi:A/G-specific adenine glycosylase